MREILFRGKRADNGKWVEGNLFIPDSDNRPTQILMGTDIVRISYEIDPETVGQFIGITDKNGKKIFEGDIMQLSAGTYPCLVYFDGRGFKWLRNNKRIDIDLTFEKMAVIGNIYDNPELLKGDDEICDR